MEQSLRHIITTGKSRGVGPCLAVVDTESLGGTRATARPVGVELHYGMGGEQWLLKCLFVLWFFAVYTYHLFTKYILQEHSGDRFSAEELPNLPTCRVGGKSWLFSNAGSNPLQTRTRGTTSFAKGQARP